MIRVAVLWLTNSDHELLLAQRALVKIQDPGVWGPTVTGKIEEGEQAVEAIIRETKEELNLDLNPNDLNFLLEKDFKHPDGQIRQFHIFTSQVAREITDLTKVDPAEVAGVEWQAFSQVLDNLTNNPDSFVPSAKYVWPDTFRALRKYGFPGE